MFDQPWARVSHPTPVPAEIDAEMLESLSDQAFAELLRDNLLPRPPAVPRESWDQLWAALAGEDDLADRAFDALEDFLESLAGLRASGRAGEAELKRAAKFEVNVNAAWARLERAEVPATVRVRQLAFAISRHRALTRQSQMEPSAADVALWRVLRRLGLDG